MLQPFFLLPTMLHLWLVGQLPSMNACSSANFKQGVSGKRADMFRLPSLSRKRLKNEYA